ncbi:deoxyribonuclease V [Nitrococcus mobilis]|uniref:Endonuclease V n=1 Tax=Nitrococcus mobilis Nb-231 TaxID=314278 RepID=A4BNQ0_9GAMM|nr:deoxyribonuclease V [Nitrococcus mobilis]EAR22849.1 endonuclease V [Nitrococcus mobilis Nb-231]
MLMPVDPGHDWSVTPKEAIALQRILAARVHLQSGPKQVRCVAGVDTGFVDHGRMARAAVVVLSFPELVPLETRIALEPTPFPYIPGLLSFRELPVVLHALEKLSILPDLVLCDGQGIAHPRRLGIAAHLGVVTGLPTIGVGKSRLIGDYREPGMEKGCVAPLMDAKQRIGTVVRTRRAVRPLFISPGHRTDHVSAVEWTLACTGRYRLPEPIRMADRVASARRGSERNSVR